MILKNKKLLLITSLVTLLPIPVGLALKAWFPMDTGMDFGAFYWLPALSLLGAHWLCILASCIDTGNKERNQKPLTMVLWIVPVLSNVCCGILYALMMGIEMVSLSWYFGMFGAMFAVIGNYMPKIKMNSTMGIKVSWTYSSEANWNATHRFAGKVWFIGGIVMMFGIFLPEMAAAGLMVAAMIILVALPLVYSWRFYRREKGEGKDVKPGYPMMSKKFGKGAMVVSAALLLFVVAIMASGDLNYVFGEDSFTVEADWFADMTVRYESIESVEYRQSNMPGSRIGGFGSARLLMGAFRNEEFGNYTRYTYYSPDACVVLTVKGKTVVLSAEDAAGTRTLYETIAEKVS